MGKKKSVGSKSKSSSKGLGHVKGKGLPSSGVGSNLHGLINSSKDLFKH